MLYAHNHADSLGAKHLQAPFTYLAPGSQRQSATGVRTLQTCHRHSAVQVLDMLPVADSVTKLASRCAFCDAAALFSLRTAADQAAQEMVGGSDLYRPVCRRHYVQHMAVGSPVEVSSAEA